MADFLLDTCAAIWIAQGESLREPAASKLPKACERGGRLLVSPVTAWEVALLAAKGKIALAISPEVWFKRVCALPGVALAQMPPSVLIASTNLPGVPPGDPMDRILVATAREYGDVLVTRDKKILKYGNRGHLQVIEC